MRAGRRRFLVTWTLLLATAMIWCASPASAQIDAVCTGSVTLNYNPPASNVLPPATPPHTIATGGGTITNCVAFDGGLTTGTFTVSLEGEMTCTSAQNVAGTLDIVWSDSTVSYAEVSTLLPVLSSVGGAAGLTATVTSGRFAGQQLQINNVRDPLALLRCTLNGMPQATGTTILTFTQPL
jgi:hypothetical protein